MKPSISSCAKRAADGLIAVILAACLIIRDRITCRRKIESTRVNQMPWSRSTFDEANDPKIPPGTADFREHGGSDCHIQICDAVIHHAPGCAGTKCCPRQPRRT